MDNAGLTAALLRAPPFGGVAANLSRVVTAWQDVPPGEHAEPADLAGIIEKRVGANFWRSDILMGNRTLPTVIMPRDVNAATGMWHRIRAEQPVGAYRAVLPKSRRFAALAERLSQDGAEIVVDGGNPHDLLDRACDIFVPEIADFAVLGLLAGRPVFVCSPQDLHRQSPGRAAAWVTTGTAYENPFTGQAATCAEIVALLADWRRILARNRGLAACVGVTFWKRRRVTQLFANGGTPPKFCSTTKSGLRTAKLRGGAVAVWSTRVPADLAQKAAAAGVAVLRIEDGFIRSVGLGSDFLPPSSVVVDGRTNHFDPSRPSDLEELLAHTEFDQALLVRAKQLIARLAGKAISKYGAGGNVPVLRAQPGQRVILVPGQVANDLSVLLGGGAVRGNADLLARVRAANPEAFIIYRPHPDVVAGHRPGAIADPIGQGLADQICADGAIARLIDQVDEVHTLTSLTGFEALLRGRRVVTYGQPFYAGWGLTTDHAPVARRQRRLTVEELVAATLILYPLYVDPKTGLPCGPEVLIAGMDNAVLWRPSVLMRGRRLQGKIRNLWPALRKSAP